MEAMNTQSDNTATRPRTLRQILLWEAIQTPIEMAWVALGLYMTLGSEPNAFGPWLLMAVLPFSYARRYIHYAAPEPKRS